MTETPSSETTPDASGFHEWMESLSRQSDPAFAIVAGSTLEDWILHALQSKMRDDLSATVSNRIFEGYGPLSTFAAKIDIGYAFNLFDEETFAELRAIKDIRNKFAHSKQYLHFGSPELAHEMVRLKGWSKSTNQRVLFRDRINACIAKMKPHIETAVLVAALKAYKPQIASPDKSDKQSPPHSPAPGETGASEDGPPQSSGG